MSAAPASAVTIEGREVRFTNLDKVLYPAAGFTKGEVIDYYRKIAPVLLPHLKGHALTLKRYPNGVDQPFFYEKRCPVHRPDWVKTASVWSDTNNENIDFCVAADAATLAWMANLASLEIHPLLSRADKPDRPTAMVFDFDPGPPAGALDCVQAALKMHEILDHLGLQSFAKTSGGKGIHLWIPLNTPVTFAQTKQFSHGVALLMERQSPAEITSNMSKSARGGKVFIDWSQNDSHKTTAAVYSLRARETPSVSTPISWDEMRLAAKKKDPARLVFTPAQALARVKKLGDLFEPVLKLKQKLPKFDAGHIHVG
ncbi:MAG TPA: non-homologous end-joining DNA ligase [Tepidisphaeraceae bacterium]|jgi:bifunctional non-homologous end joining protein LigD|nr:non-homologous end-joining DNA ligase [Tepidisphaeraceae bacterium]